MGSHPLCAERMIPVAAIGLSPDQPVCKKIVRMIVGRVRGLSMIELFGVVGNGSHVVVFDLLGFELG